MHSDSKKRHSFLAQLFAAGDVRRSATDRNMKERSSNCLLCDISHASLHGDIDEVKQIIDNGVDLSIDDECNTALFDAIESNKFDIADILLKNGADINRPHPLINSLPIELAIENMKSDWVKFLLKNNAVVDDQILLKLIPMGDSPDRIRLALSTGINPNIISEDWRRSPLHLACMYGYIETVKVLIEAGAILSKQDKNGSFPLDLAKVNKHDELVEYITTILGRTKGCTGSQKTAPSEP